MNISNQVEQAHILVRRIALERHDDKMLFVSSVWTGVYYKVTLCKSGPEGRPFTEIVRISELEERIKKGDSNV